MRLFVAVNFNEEFKLKLARVLEEVRKAAERGNFTRIQNLHLTLQFIGETERLMEASAAVNAVDFEYFPLSFDRLSGFRRQGSEICWLGGPENGELAVLAATVGQELKRRGFRLEARPFVAHLTLGREVVFKNGYEPGKFLLPELKTYVNQISLMKSERVNGLLTYSEVAIKKALNR